MAELTIDEARILYNSGHKEIALKFYKETEILNNFKAVTHRSLDKAELPDSTYDNDLKMLWHAYLQISKGRELKILEPPIYTFYPFVYITKDTTLHLPNTLCIKSVYIENTLVDAHLGVVRVSNIDFSHLTKLNYYYGTPVLSLFGFKEREQAEHFLLEFWWELLRVSCPFVNIYKH